MSTIRLSPDRILQLLEVAQKNNNFEAGLNLAVDAIRQMALRIHECRNIQPSDIDNANRRADEIKRAKAAQATDSGPQG